MNKFLRLINWVHPMLSSLRLRLFLLIALAIFPAFALIVFTTLQQQELTVFQAQDDILKQTRAIASLYKETLEGTRQLLPSLARISAVQTHDKDACSPIMLSLAPQYPSYANLAAVDEFGDMFCSALPMPEIPINVGDRSYFQRAMSENNFVIGEYQTSRMTGDPVITLAFPTRNSEKRIIGLVFAGLSLKWLNKQASLMELPVGAEMRLVDRNGVVIVDRHPGHLIGQVMPETSVWKALQARQEGWIENTGTDGVQRLYAFATLQMTSDADLYVCLDVPTNLAYAESNLASWRNLIALGLVSVLAMAVGRLGGDLFILRRVDALVNATKRLASGDLRARTGLPYEGGELSELSHSFDQMAAKLEQREIERKRMEEALRASVRRAEALANAAERLNARLKLDDVVKGICEETARALNVPATSVCLYDKIRDQFDLVADHGLPLVFRQEMKGISSNLYTELVHKIGSPIVVSDIATMPELPYFALFQSLNIRSMACATMVHQKNEIVGMLSVFTFNVREFSVEERILLRGLTEQSALAVQNARLYNELKQQEQTRALLLRQMITAQEDERMRIARELHDETSQNLTAMMVGLDTAQLVASSDPSKAHAQLETARSIATGMLGGIHRLIADLRPSLLDHRGLVPAIAWYGDQRLKPLGITLHLEENLTDRLPPLTETCLFRIVQEGMTNVIRHSYASNMLVRLIQEDNWLTLQLSDDGRGFDADMLLITDDSDKGLGLRGIQERADILGGIFDLQTAPAHGTVITITVPLSRQENAHG